jgi:hypothetical protein
VEGAIVTSQMACDYFKSYEPTLRDYYKEMNRK